MTSTKIHATKYGDYLARDRAGVVHICLDRDWVQRLDYGEVEDYERLLDETICGEMNYLSRVDRPTSVTCIICLGEASPEQQDLS